MHLAFIKYTVMRLAIFVISLMVLYAVGVRESILMLVLAAVISLAASYLLLRKQRDELARAIAERTSGRLDDRHRGFGSTDADAEDAAVDQRSGDQRSES